MESALLRWIILLPLIGAAFNGLVLRSRHGYISGIVASAASAGAFAVSLMLLLKVGSGVALDPWFTWFEAGAVKVPFHLEYTPLTGLMLMVVTGIGTLIHVFATGYMSHDASPYRFFAYLNLFLAAMLTLLLSSNLVGVFLGWEGVGLCSYLLIGYWFEKDENTAAGMKAFVVNRVGDLGFLLALMALVATIGTTQISEVLAKAGQIPPAAALLICFGIFWAATGKSAQIPLYVWLPDAMAGPTPVSALIHAATMVTSGIFVITRLWPLFAAQAEVLQVILWGGLATAYLAALTALTQRDIKKVLAYSTVSQLGFMFVALGCGSPTAAMFHVMTHACFKALLFLGAGSVIHGVHEKQDIFVMGGLKKHMPLTHITFLIATLAIIGFPLSSGFFSKDMILAKAYEVGPVFYALLLGAALLTAFYMFRLYALVFHGAPRSSEASHAHESAPVMTLPLAVLAVLSVLVGWFETPEVIGGIHTLQHAIEGSWYGVAASAQHAGHHLSHATEWLLMGLTSALSLGLAYVAFRKFSRKPTEPNEASFFVRLSLNKFYVDEVYQFVFARPVAWLSGVVTNLLDGCLINGLLHACKESVYVGGRIMSVFHSGNVQTYAWYLGFGAALALTLGLMVFK